MGRLINAGFGNVVNTDRIIAIISPDSSPAKRIIQSAKDNGICIDVTQGRKTKSIIITDTDKIFLSALMPETLTLRYNNDRENISYKGEEDE